jgi:hypothetical protein
MNAAPRLRRTLNAVGVLALLMTGMSACSRAHLTATHGRAYREVFAAQDANPNRKAAQSVNGLDSQEAAIIAGNYRKALSPKSEDAGAGQQRLLMVAPQRPVGDSSGLPSSVPSGSGN